MPLSSISDWIRRNSWPAFFSASFSSSSERSRRCQRNQSWRSLTPKLISPFIVVTQARKPGPNSSRRAIGSNSFGTVVQKRLLKSSDSNSTLREKRCWTCSVALDRLDVEGGDDLGQVGHVGLGEDRGRQHRLVEEAAHLAFVGVAGGAPEALDQLPGEPVDAADAERHRPVFGIDPADRLVGDFVALAVAAHQLGPVLRFLLGAHRRDPSGARARRKPVRRAPDRR